MILDKESVLVKPQRLFELDQHLLGEPMAVSLLRNERAEKAAPDEACDSDHQRIEGCQPILLWAQEQREQHGKQPKGAEGREPHHLFTPSVDLLFVEGIQDG